MKKQACVVGIILVMAAAAAVIYFGDFDLGIDNTFDNEGRYDSTVLNNMGVIYSNQSDIAMWNNGFSKSDSCPWNATHNGLDYFFFNNSDVIAAAPGIVEDIELGYVANGTVYKVAVHIRFNSSLTIEYGFEGFSTDVAMRAQQADMIDVEIGDWVAKGDQIGKFLRPTEYDHVHFSVYVNDSICPRLVMGEDDYNEIMSLVHSFHATWDLCYP